MSSGPNYQPTYPPSLAHVPDVQFAVKDPQIIRDEAIRDYEAAYRSLTRIAKTLAPADPIRMLILTVCQLIVQLRVMIDQGCKMNLLKYSVKDFLTELAALYGPRADRIEAQPATCELEFSLPLPLTFTAVIDAGAQAGTVNELVFETIQPIIIPAGQLSGSSPAKCQTKGQIGNGYVPGQVSSLVEWNQPFSVNVRNTTETANGAENEEDERYRYRTWLTPESFSTCGPEDAYRYWALRAHPDIVSCVVYSAPAIAGEAHLYPLMRGGLLPNDEVLAAVLELAGPGRRRPVADYVSAFRANVVNFRVHIEWWALRENEIVIAEIARKVNQAVDDWLLWQRGAIGVDIIPDELVRRVISAGAKRVAGPGSTPENFVPVVPAYRHLLYNELAVLESDPPADPGLTKKVIFRGFESR
jgi:phage-related baseplate assembly protein